MEKISLNIRWYVLALLIPFSLYGQKVVIQRGAYMTVQDGAKLKVVDPGNTSTITIKSDNLGSGSLVDYTTNTTGGVTVDGDFHIELYLTPCDSTLGYTGGCWHYVSSPVTNATSSVFYLDYLQKWSEPLGKWSGYITSTTEPLNPVQGYAISRPSGNSDTKTFTGTVNSQAAEFPLTRTPNKGGGYNLVGNPYPSAVDIVSNGITWNQTDAKVWYYNKAGKNYLAYTKGIGGTGSRYIPAMQGFFVHVNASFLAGSLTISNSARLHDISVPFYKGGPLMIEEDALYLKVQKQDQSAHDLLCVVFRPFATSNYDDLYDAAKMYGDAESPQLYTVTSDESYLTINVLPFAGKTTMVPLGFKVFSNGTGVYSINATNLESFRSGTSIYLEDLKENKTQELNANPVYSFTYTDRDDPARFVLKFDNPFYGVQENGKTNNIDIYSSGEYLFIKNNSGMEIKGDLYLYDMLGRLMFSKKLENKLLNKIDPEIVETGYYLVRIVTSEETYVRKVFLD
jgi:hypothetical protein